MADNYCSSRGRVDRSAERNEENFEHLDKHFRNILTSLFSSHQADDDILGRLHNLHLDVAQIKTDTSRSEKAHEDDLLKILKKSLFFPEMSCRPDSIDEAHRSTFQWIFEDLEDDSGPSSKFLDWLRQGDDIFWINGKAGSGKSTLMRYVSHEDRTQSALKDWAWPRSLIICRFYFWYLGSNMEKAQRGLLRALIYQVLEQCPRLWSNVLPASEIGLLRGLGRVDLDNFWTKSRLLMSLLKLVQEAPDNMCFCFFIDGLDELKNNNEDRYESLVESIKAIVQPPMLKICVSSRPLPIFEDAFGHCLSLRVQDLTQHDTKTLAKDRLRDNPRFCSMDAEALGSLVFTISKNSCGVFLWVTLVIRSLLEGAQNWDTFEELRTRVEELPSELSELYQRMLSQLEPCYQAQIYRAFRMTLAAKPEQYALGPDLSLADWAFVEDLAEESSIPHPECLNPAS